MPPSGADNSPIITKLSTRSVTDTVSRLLELIESKEMKVFATIDQAAEARGAGLELRDTVLVVFGNPVLGTVVMAAAPLAALDLPLKILVWADADHTNVSYVMPVEIGRRYELSTDVWMKLAGIEPLTDALIAP